MRNLFSIALLLSLYAPSSLAQTTSTSSIPVTDKLGPVTFIGYSYMQADGMPPTVQSTAFNNTSFGDNNDASIGDGNLSITAKIASIVIKGVVAGSATSGDHFGFSAQQIGSFKSFGFTALLHAPPPATPDIIELSPTTGDVTIREV